MPKRGMVCHICEGTCGAVISDKRFKEGLTKCGAEGCTMHGKPFKKKIMKG